MWPTVALLNIYRNKSAMESRLTATLIEGTVKGVIDAIKDSTGDISKKVIQALSDNFEDYLDRKYESLSEVKNILYKNKAEKLRSFYVDIELLEDKTVVSTNNVDRFLEDRRRVIIKGPAGCGKSLFSRNIFMKVVKSDKHGIPVHLKLRKLNDDENSTVKGKIFSDIQDFNNTLDVDHFEKCLNEGSFVFIFDGLDEVKPGKREDIEKEIQHIANKYPENKIILFTRPSSSVEGWDSFESMRVRNLTKEKAIELVDNVKYEEDVREEFLQELRGGLFEKYRDFLSNPLLLTMMLITYSETSGIPSKMHVYYERVFEVLFDQHDISKGRYKRVRYTDLPLDEFRNILSAFSFITYFENESLIKSKALKNIREAISISNIEDEPSPTDYLSDLTESVCILIKDGLEYTFTHRSFQEYFTALFISNTNSENKEEIIKKLSKTQNIDPELNKQKSAESEARKFFHRSELTLYLLYGMDPSSVDRDFFIPFLKSLIDHIGNLNSNNDKISFLKDVHPNINILRKDDIFVTVSLSITDKLHSEGAFGPHIHSLYSCYPHFWENIFAVKEDLSEPVIKSYSDKLSDERDYIRLDFDSPIQNKEIKDLMDVDWHVDKILQNAKQNLEHLENKYNSTDKEIRDIVGL